MSEPLREFIDSLNCACAPAGTNATLLSVWHGLKGSWHEAHETVQVQTGPDAAWIHAWLHRVEGDLANANYWYRRAKRPVPSGDTRVEGEAIAAELLAR